MQNRLKLSLFKKQQRSILCALLVAAVFLLNFSSCTNSHSGLCQSRVSAETQTRSSCADHSCGHKKPIKCDFTGHEGHLHDYLMLSPSLPGVQPDKNIIDEDICLQKDSTDLQHNELPREIVPRFLFHETAVLII